MIGKELTARNREGGGCEYTGPQGITGREPLCVLTPLGDTAATRVSTFTPDTHKCAHICKLTSNQGSLERFQVNFLVVMLH